FLCPLGLEQEGLFEGSLPLQGEAYRAAAGFPLRPLLGNDTLEDDGTQRPGEMRAPHAPVKAAPADGPSPARQRLGVDADTDEGIRPRFSHFEFFPLARDDAAIQESVEHCNRVFAGEMVVADACYAHRLFAGTGPCSLRSDG